MPKGNIIIRRQVLFKDKIPDWKSSSKGLTSISALAKGTIEDSGIELQADFANEYIGGGVLGGGCVQEEVLIVFELIVRFSFSSNLNVWSLCFSVPRWKITK